MIDEKTLKAFVRRESYDESVLVETIQGISRMVVLKSPYILDYSEDVSVGVLKCWELLNSEHVDPARSLVRFLFCGVRNTLVNRSKKESKINDAVEEKQLLNGLPVFKRSDSWMDDYFKYFDEHFSQVCGSLYFMRKKAHQFRNVKDISALCPLMKRIAKAIMVKFLWERSISRL